MKLKNIKNNIIVLNSVWICKGIGNGLDYSKNFSVDLIYKYLSGDYTIKTIDSSIEYSIKDVFEIKYETFRKNAKDNKVFICEILSKNLEEIKKIDSNIAVTKSKFFTTTAGPLRELFAKSVPGYTVNDSIKKYLYNLVTNSLKAKDELINELKKLNNVCNTKENLNVKINELKKVEKYKDIIEFDEFKKIIENIKLKISENKDDKKNKHKDDKTKDKEEEEKKKKEEKNKKQIEEKNKDLNEKLDNLFKTPNYDSIKSADLDKNFNDIKKSIFIDGFDESKVNENNKKLISKIEADIQNKKTKEIEEENKNKSKDELKNDLIKKLNDIITNSTNKKSSDIENDLNSILNVLSYNEFFKEEEINKLVEKIKEIINKKKEEEKTKEPGKEDEEEDGEDEDSEEEDDDNKNKNDDNENKDLPSAPAPVEDKKGYCGKNKKADSASNKEGYFCKKNKN